MAIARLDFIDQLNCMQVQRISSKAIKGVSGHGSHVALLDLFSNVSHHAHVGIIRIDLYDFRGQNNSLFYDCPASSDGRRKAGTND